jgi:uncharacterized membrane protein
MKMVKVGYVFLVLSLISFFIDKTRISAIILCCIACVFFFRLLLKWETIMIIFGSISLVVGIFLYIYGNGIKNDVELQLKSFVDNGIRIGIVAIILGCLLIVCGVLLSLKNKKEENKIQCPNCKAEISREIKFCPDCGKEIVIDKKELDSKVDKD